MNEALRNFCILLIVVIGIWFLGPFIAFDGHVLLGEDEHRLLLILICTLIWGGNNLYLKYRRQQAKPQPSEKDDPVSQAQSPLIHNYQTVLTLSKQIGPQSSSEPPCTLVIGQTNSGKSELLHHAGMKRTKMHHSTPYQWWLNGQGIFIELDTLDNASVLTARHQLIDELKNKRKQGLNGVILVFSLRQLLIQDPQALTTQIEHINQLMIPLKSTTIPITLIISHCDLVAGFTDFFKPLTDVQKQHAFGVNLTQTTDDNNTLNTFSTDFQALLAKLTRQTISETHHQTHARKQTLNDFPMQLESLQPLFKNLLKQLLALTKIKIQGLYFISNMQQGTPRNFIQETIQQTWDFTSQKKPQEQTAETRQAYFIQHLFEHFQQSPTTTGNQLLQQSWLYYLVGAIGLSIISLGGYFWYQSYSANLVQIKAATTRLSQTISPNASAFNQLLIRLNRLSPQPEINTTTKQWYHRLNYHKAQQFRTLINQTYQQNLINELLPQIKTTLEKQLQLAQTPTALYDTLSAYLMLGHPQALHDADNRNFITHLVSSDWQTANTHTPAQQRQLAQHLANLLQLSPHITLDKRLLQMGQKKLAKIPLPQLVLFSLSQYLHEPSIHLVAKNSLLMPAAETKIPAQYTAEYVKKMLVEIIPEACKTFIQDDRVLRDKPNLDQTSIKALVNNVRKLYLQQYRKTWAQALAELQIAQFNTTAAAAKAIKAETQKHPPLLDALLAIKYNTAPIANLTEFKSLVSQHFKEIGDLINGLQDKKVRTAIAQLSDYLNKINDAEDPMQAAFNAAKTRMQTNGQHDPITALRQAAHNQPDLLYSWLNSIATHSWKAVLADTTYYINQAWQESVLPQYEIDINHRYPIFKDANSNISLTAFSAFFGPGGAMEQFFTQYLKPFVVHKKIYWNWREVDGQYLNISQSSLDSFIRASLIRKMFFAGDSAAPHIRFTLRLKSLATETRLLVINLDGKTQSFTANNRDVVDFNWPGPHPNIANFHMESLSGQPEILSAQGPWALFRLFDKVKLNTNLNTQKFDLNINMDGIGAELALAAGNVINPFIPGVVSSFRAPKTL